MTARFLLLALCLGSASVANAWGDLGLGISSDQAHGPQLDVALNYSPQGGWAIGARGRCTFPTLTGNDGLCAAEGRLRGSLEVFRTVPRLSLGYGTQGVLTSLMLDRFLTRRSSLRGEVGWRSSGGFFGQIGVGIFPFD